MITIDGTTSKNVQIPIQMKVTQIKPPQPRIGAASNVRLTFPVNRVLRSTENIQKTPEIRIVYQNKNINPSG